MITTDALRTLKLELTHESFKVLTNRLKIITNLEMSTKTPYTITINLENAYFLVHSHTTHGKKDPSFNHKGRKKHV